MINIQQSNEDQGSLNYLVIDYLKDLSFSSPEIKDQIIKEVIIFF